LLLENVRQRGIYFATVRDSRGALTLKFILP
jgi:hypothetical protein